jgi:hypothetical protein
MRKRHGGRTTSEPGKNELGEASEYSEASARYK